MYQYAETDKSYSTPVKDKGLFGKDIFQRMPDDVREAAGEGASKAQRSSNHTGMPDNLKSAIESLSGYSMDDVRVHYNSSKPAQLNALAYTQGTEIHVAPGQERHLPHEAWHVVQQKQGRVAATTQVQGVNINDNSFLEHEADVMGDRAVQGKFNNISVLRNHVPQDVNIIQRKACLRCMCEAEYEQIKRDGIFKSQGRKAKWCTEGGKTTEPNISSFGDSRHDYLISFTIADGVFTAHPIVYVEDDRPVESEHTDDIIGKSNEPGNFGIGCNLLPSIPVKPFEWTTKKKIIDKASKLWTRVK